MTQGLAPLLDAKGNPLPVSGTSIPAPSVTPGPVTAPVPIEAGPDVTRRPVLLKSGAIGTMPITELDDPAIARELTPAEFREHLETEAKERSPLHQMIAGAEGVARGLSGGQTDIAAKGLAGTFFGNEAERETARHLREEKEAHPYVAGAAEFGGFGLGMFTGSGEEAAAGKLATAEKVAPELSAAVEAMRGEGSTSALMKGLKLVGEAPTAGSNAAKLIEQQTAKLLGGGAAAKIAGTTLGGAAEGALYSADSQLDEQVLGDQELNGEKIASAAGYGALMGGTLAGGAATFSTLAKKGLVASSPAIEKMAAEQAFRAAGPTLATAREAERRAGGAAAIGRTMLERDVIPSEGSALERALTPEELVPRNKAALNQIGKEMGEVIDNAGGARVPMADVMDAFSKQIDRLESTAATSHIAESVKDFQERFLSKVAGDVMSTPAGEIASIPIQTLIRERRGLGDLAFKEAKALDPKMRVEALRNIYGAWSDLETTALDKASADIGGAEGQKLRALNKEYQQLKIVAESLDRSAAASIRNRAISPSDYMTGIGAIAGIHSGGITSALGAGFSTLAHKFIRERGNSLAASYLDRLSQLGAIRKVVAGVDADTEKAVSAFMAGKRAGQHETLSLPPYRGGQLQRRFQDALEDASEPPKSVDFTHAPGIGRAVRSTLMKAASFLQSKIPEPTVDRYSLTPQLEKKQYTPQDMTAFLRYYEAARHPGLLAHELAQGKVHPETVEAVQAVAPKLYAELQQKVMQAAQDLKHPLSYDQKIQLGVLFNQPTHWSLDPVFLRAYQATKAPPAGPAPAPGGKAPGKPRGHRSAAPLHVSQYATAVDTVQMGGAARAPK